MRKSLHPGSGPAISLLTAILFLSLCAPCPDASARQRKATRKPAAAPAPAASPVVSGLVVAVDPQSGRQSLPTLEQLSELSALEQRMLSRSDVGLVQHRLANGAVVLDLDGRFQEFTTVRIGPGGKKYFSCLDDPPALRRAIQPAGGERDASGLEVK